MLTTPALTFLTVTTLPALVLLTTTLPNDRLVGENVSGALDPPEPLPDRPTSCGLNGALCVTVSAPLMLPFTVGWKVTASVQLLWAANVVPQGVVPPATAE